MFPDLHVVSIESDPNSPDVRLRRIACVDGTTYRYGSATRPGFFPPKCGEEISFS